MHVGYFVGQLHGRRDHVETVAVIAQRQEYITEQYQTARRQTVEVLGIGHFQCFTQIPLGIGEMLLKKSVQSLNIEAGGSQTV